MEYDSKLNRIVKEAIPAVEFRHFALTVRNIALGLVPKNIRLIEYVFILN